MRVEEEGWNVVGESVLVVVCGVLMEMCQKRGTCWKPQRRASCLVSLSVRSCLKQRTATSDSASCTKFPNHETFLTIGLQIISFTVYGSKVVILEEDTDVEVGVGTCWCLRNR